MNYDLEIPGITGVLGERIKTEINDRAKDANPPRFSWRVKPSDLANDCVAELWLNFRWVKQGDYDGRMARLFKRGHKAEAGLVDYLRAAGWEIREYSKRLIMRTGDGKYVSQEWEDEIPGGYEDVSLDPVRIADALADDEWILKQYRVKDFEGHLSGYLDAIGRHPEYSQGEWWNVEFKTYNTKRFSTLVNKTVSVSDPKYYGQLVLYMEYRNLPATLFCAVNKNDDDILIKVLRRDPVRFKELTNIAHTVVNSRAMPARLSMNPTHYKCKHCSLVDICHNGAPPAKSCRSCFHCLPMEGGNFRCEKYGPIPGEKEILAGCGEYKSII